MRVVYSFSVPDNSVAHWQLKKWKADGRVISHLIEKLIEGDGPQILALENEIQALRWKAKRQSKILRSIQVANPKMKLPEEWNEVVDHVDA
jgi:hypothetical protein